MEPSVDLLIWKSRHRGTMTSIATEAKVSPQFVHMVLHGHRTSSHGRVEKLLREAGAPLPDPEAELVA